MAQQGSFVWYDLMTTDPSGAMDFYSRVMGWEARDAGMPSPYMLLHAGSVPIAGAIQLSEEDCQSGGARTGWMGHVLVADCDAAAAQTERLGGKMLRAPSDIPGIGRFAVISDPHGATLSLYAHAAENPPGPRPKMGDPGHVGWRELHAGDREAAWAFYSALFGWEKVEAVDMGPMGVYQTFRDAGAPDGQAIGGMMTKMPSTPAAHWLFYVSVDAAGASAERIKAAGGQVAMGPIQVPGGGWIVIGVDPQGGAFATLADKP